MAGILGLINSNAPNLTTEIGFIVVFPKFQRTYVTTNAVCILLRYALEIPSRFPGALALRRVEWRANSRNEPSKKAAKRIGFKDEGVMRCMWCCQRGKRATCRGKEIRNKRT